ncbi:hypothetical protein GCM10010234_10170 [Streptomyces hawaiiensis]
MARSPGTRHYPPCRPRAPGAPTGASAPGAAATGLGSQRGVAPRPGRPGFSVGHGGSLRLPPFYGACRVGFTLLQIKSTPGRTGIGPTMKRPPQDADLSCESGELRAQKTKLIVDARSVEV